MPALAALLGDEKLSHMARYGLEPIPDASVDDALRDAFGKLKGRPLAGVIGSIGVRRDAKAVEPLARLLQNPDADVVQAAARALGRIGTPDAAKALEDALPGVRAANQPALCEGLLRAAEALAAKGQRDQAIAIYDRLRSLQPAPHQVRTAALRGAILTRGQDGLSLLQEHLQSKDYLLFAAAVRTSQEMRGPAVTKRSPTRCPCPPRITGSCCCKPSAAAASLRRCRRSWRRPRAERHASGWPPFERRWKSATPRPCPA